VGQIWFLYLKCNHSFWAFHDLCLYADVILSAINGALYFILHKKDVSANELIFYSLFGVVAHGTGHGAIAANLRDENLKQCAEDDISYLEAMSDKTWCEFILRLFYDQWAYLIFWLLLLKTTMPQSSMNEILSLSVVSWLSAQRNKPSFQFTHVQTILLLAFTLNQY